MRISTSHWYQAQTAAMSALQARAARSQSQIATGRRLDGAADDPIASARIDVLGRRQRDTEQHIRQAATVDARLRTSETALGGMSEVLTQLREVVVQAGNDTLSAADRLALATEVAGLRDELLRLVNSRDADGHHVFAGAASRGTAFAADAAGRIVWTGQGHPPSVAVGDGLVIESGDRGLDILGAPSSSDPARTAFDVFDNITAALTAADGDTADGRALRHARLDDASDVLASVSDKVIEAQAQQGVRLARLDAASENFEADLVDLAAERSALEDTDVTAAVVEMQRTLTLLEAAQASFTQIARLSLFSRI